MTDKEVRAIAIKEVTYADMIAIGATEEIATAASWKAKCAFEASWDCAVEKICKWLKQHSFDYLIHDMYDNWTYDDETMISDLRKTIEE